MRLWSELTDREVKAARHSLVAIPVGAIEQHGPHLPVDVDIRLCSAVSRLAAGRTERVKVLVAPALPFGFSPHHLSWPGTLSLKLGSYLAVLRDIAESALDSGFPRVVFVNGHGGNSAPLRALVTELVTGGLPVAAIDYWSPGEWQWVALLHGGLKRAGHACEFETALTMALAQPEAAARIAEAARHLAPRLTQPWLASGEDDPVTKAGAAWPPIFQADDCGYYGDPAAARIETGRQMLDVVVAGLANFFDEFAAAPLRVGVSRDPSAPRISPPLVK